jgi:hypothetical protein
MIQSKQERLISLHDAMWRPFDTPVWSSGLQGGPMRRCNELFRLNTWIRRLLRIGDTVG